MFCIKHLIRFGGKIQLFETHKVLSRSKTDIQACMLIFFPSTSFVHHNTSYLLKNRALPSSPGHETTSTTASRQTHMGWAFPWGNPKPWGCKAVPLLTLGTARGAFLPAALVASNHLVRSCTATAVWGD